MGRNIRARLERLEQQHAEQGLARPLLTWDELLALPSGDPLLGTDEDGPRFRIAWDSLTRTSGTQRDPATLIPPAAIRMQQLAAALSALPKNGFVSVSDVPQPSAPTEGEAHDRND